jgi:hypothetical protein
MYSTGHYDRCTEVVRQIAGDRFEALELQITAAAVAIVNNSRAAARAAAMLGFTSEDDLRSPAVLVGAPDDLCERLWQARERWGFSNFVVPAEVMYDFAPVVADLTGN